MLGGLEVAWPDLLWLRDDGPSAGCELDIPGKRIEVLRNKIGVGILETNLTRRDAQIKMVSIRRLGFAEFEISYTTLQAVSNLEQYYTSVPQGLYI